MRLSTRTEYAVAPAWRSLMIVLGLALAACVCACSTTEGFGNDVKHLGGDIEGSAARNK
ncbi:MAG: hypothetical protein WC718_06885 [Phycisphaerales bacterium]